MVGSQGKSFKKLLDECAEQFSEGTLKGFFSKERIEAYETMKVHFLISGVTPVRISKDVS